ncbi:MAG TPA: hypothetical protein VMH04_11485 [Candidatus Solibacter sp.]|nr:hypothetical protein [Candidatus Solibacter sp.]
MVDTLFGSSTPQFGTAEYATRSDQCHFCQQPLSGTYYKVNGALACGSCADRVKSEKARDTHSAFVRAVAAGIGAAIAGLIAYAVISIILQGWVISYMSFGVGWLVGTAMIKASGGTGGRRYQIAAVLLTYAAVSMAAIPIWIYLARNHHPQQTEQQKLRAEQRQLEKENGQKPSEPAPEAEPQKPRITLGAWLVKVSLLGLASPFLELEGNFFWGLIGLFILFIGLKIAWRLTAGRPIEILGPFHDAIPQSAG